MKKISVIFLYLFLFSCYPSGNLGIVKIEGVIWDYEDKVREINYFIEQNPSIKALTVYINSPGGGASASYQIFSAIKKFKEKTGKKVYAYISSIGASGGYYIACSADKIISDPNSLTGSIGVRASFLYYYELLQKIGVYEKTLKSGKFKDIGSPFREMTKEEEKIIQDFIEDVYQQFVEIVSKSRKMPEEKVKEIADGRIFSGKKAKELGLVDTTCSFEDFKEILKKELNIKRVKFFKAPVRKKGFLRKILELKQKILSPDIRVEYRFP